MMRADKLTAHIDDVANKVKNSSLQHKFGRQKKRNVSPLDFLQKKCH